MPMLEPRVDETKLRELLAEQHESEVLEYIGACDLRERRDVVELASEVGAMAACGGYVVIGADDRGVATTMFNADQAMLFDDATLRHKLSKYLPLDLEIRVGRHPTGTTGLVVIYVVPHPGEKPDEDTMASARACFKKIGKVCLGTLQQAVSNSGRST